jgi:hypothetical protein
VEFRGAAFADDAHFGFLTRAINDDGLVLEIAKEEVFGAIREREYIAWLAFGFHVIKASLEAADFVHGPDSRICFAMFSSNRGFDLSVSIIKPS